VIKVVVGADNEDETPTTSGNVRNDLSEWQERHATLVLSQIKVLLFFYFYFIFIFLCINYVLPLTFILNLLFLLIFFSH
jgi:hypothetical protein